MFDILFFAKLDADAKPPTKNHMMDAGVDFYALGDYIIHPHTFKLVKSGITIRIPRGYMGLAKPKGKNNHLLGAGVVDAGYQGEVVFKIHNVLSEDIVIRHHDSVGQIVFLPIVEVWVQDMPLELIHKDKSERGSSGGIHTSLENKFDPTGMIADLLVHEDIEYRKKNFESTPEPDPVPPDYITTG